MNTKDIFWTDLVGDVLENAGVNPGLIFEFSDSFNECYHPGGIVLSKLIPGAVPLNLKNDARFCIVKSKDDIIECIKNSDELFPDISGSISTLF